MRVDWRNALQFCGCLLILFIGEGVGILFCKGYTTEGIILATAVGLAIGISTPPMLKYDRKEK